MIVVNPTTRQFNIPGTDLVFGVTDDASSEIKHFQCPRYVGNNVDVAGSFVRINYRNGNGEIDSYLVQDLRVDGSNVLFDWILSQNVTMYRGNINFVMCVVGPDTKVKWHTTLGRGQVLEGLEPDSHIVEEATVDVVAALIALVQAQTAVVEKTGADQVAVVKAAAKTAQDSAVAQIEAKRTNSLASIPADYTAVQNAVRGAANAIRGKASGEVIRVDDVSPMEHYPMVRVHGKNLIPYPYKQNASSDFGGTFAAQADGSVLVSGTPTGYASLSLYEGVPLVRSGKVILSCSGDATNISLEMAMYDINRTMLFYRETSASLPPISVDLDLYPFVTSWVIYMKRTMSNVEMTGVAYPQLEFGEVATEYTPYINPTTIKITRCGKNILPYPYATSTQTYNGITFTPREDGSVTINGTATGDSSFMFVNPNIGQRRFLPAGTYYLSCPELASADNRAIAMPLFYYDSNETTEVGGTIIRNNVLTLTEGKYYGLYIRIYNGTTVSNLTVHPQLEHGNVATGYEPYKGEIQIPVADGTVTGLKAVSPTMTLLTDTPGVTIDCEYSRDTNKVIEEIMNKLAALVGNT